VEVLAADVAEVLESGVVALVDCCACHPVKIHAGYMLNC